MSLGCFLSRLPEKEDGLSFVEIMVTLVILSVGIVAIYKVLFSSLDHMAHLNSRLYANIMLEDQIATMERMLRSYKVLPLELDQVAGVDVGVKEMTFQPQLKISAVDEFTDIFRVDLLYTWADNGRSVQLSRSAYIYDLLLGNDGSP